MKRPMGVLLVAGVLAGAAVPGQADEPGSSVVFGAGVSQFAADGLRDLTGPGTLWEIRFAFGTRRSIGFEAAYVGTAQSLDAAGMGPDAAVFSNGADVGVRFNAFTDTWQPYAFMGVGWRHYEIMSTDDVFIMEEDQDDVIVLPLGAGISYRIGRIVLDLRGSFRIAEGEDPMPAMSGPEARGASRLDTFDVAAHIGWEL